MARTAIHDEAEIEAAKRLAEEATSLMQLRQSQAILIPALTGASLETTAEIVGLSRDRVCVLRRQFRADDRQGVDARERRGGRRRELMSVTQEVSFLAPWAEKAESGGVLVVPPMHAALEQVVGHKVPKSTVYRMLARHGWRKIAPDTRHPNVDFEAQGLFQKTSRRPLPRR
jgi:transposase